MYWMPQEEDNVGIVVYASFLLAHQVHRSTFLSTMQLTACVRNPS